MQPLFSRIYPGMYDSNIFTSFTDCSRQGKVMPGVAIHANKPAHKKLTENT